jgi:hypothetical protein
MVLALLIATSAVEGHGGRRGGCGGGGGGYGGDYGYGGGCATAVTWVEQEVLVWRAITKEREVKGVAREVVSKEVEEKVKWNEYQNVVTPEKRKVQVCKIETKEVEYKYTYLQPVITPEKRKVMEYTCQPVEEVRAVPVCRMVPVVVTDCCGCQHTVCQRVVEMQNVKVTTMKPVGVEKEVMVNICNYKSVDAVGKRVVATPVMVEEEITINVCRTVTVPKEAMVKRLEYSTVEKPVTYKERYCEYVQVKEKVRVPVYTAGFGGQGGCGGYGPGYGH